MWIVKKLDKDQYQRYDPRKQRLLGKTMSYAEIIAYCEARPTDLFARNFLTFIGSIDTITITDNEKSDE